MIKAGDVMENPLIGYEFRFFGHRFHIIESSRDTEDRSLRFRVFRTATRAHSRARPCFSGGTVRDRLGGARRSRG